MMLLAVASLSFLFLSLLIVPDLAIINDTQSVNTTTFLLDIIKEHQEPSVPGVPNQRSFADGTINTNIFTVFNYNGSQIYVYGALANEIENKFNQHR